jgi:DNA-binding response OmpR family regulator
MYRAETFDMEPRSISPLPLLLVEDDIDLAATVRDHLERRGWSVEHAPNGAKALALVMEHSYALVILDQRMPGLTGLELCRRMRGGIARHLPVLMLTAADSLEDRLAGFAAGVDDYLVKPFALAELQARIAALIRRAAPERWSAETSLRFSVLELDRDQHRARRGERVLDLTRMGYSILELLMRRAPSIVRRQELERHLWGEELPGSDALRTHIYALRAVLDSPGEPAMLVTRRGVGYQLIASPE